MLLTPTCTASRDQDMCSSELFCRALCGQRLTLPLRGRLPSQRPRPSNKLHGWIRLSIRALLIQIVWSLGYFGLSLSRRGGSGLIGMLLNPVYVASAACGMHGALNLSWQTVAFSAVASFVTTVAFLLFVLLNYVGSVRSNSSEAWVVLALFVPGLVVDNSARPVG